MTSSDDGETADHLVRAAATQLYAGAPADFIATRTALVKAARSEGHKDEAKVIATLRRPSVAAWALNQVVHAGDPVIDELTNLGARLRRATATLDAAGLAGLRGARDAALAALVAAAAKGAESEGQRLTAPVEAEVRDTGIAALADEAAEAALRSGTLTRALSYSGFGEVDLSEATATTSTGVVLTSLRGGRRRQKEDLAETEPEDEGDDLDDGDELDEVRVPDKAEDLETEGEGDGGASEDDESDGDDEDDDGEDDGAAALAEAAAEEERERREAQAEEERERREAQAEDERERHLADAERAVGVATKEIGRHRAAVEAARNRSDATRQRIQKLEAQLDKARAEDEVALEKLTEAVGAAKRADADLSAAQETLADLQG